jgi:SAM-dependent methyltransferase
MTDGSLRERSEALSETAFLGGPRRDFERVGRLGFDVLLREGLRPSSRVLDVGCGALRLGYWLMRFLDAGCYYGIEPNQDMLRIGLEEIVEPDVVARASAHFAHNDDFDFSGFGAEFEFAYARSIWTHASKDQIRAMLASFAATAAPDGVFLASYYPASPVFQIGRRWPRSQRLVPMLPLARLSPVVAGLPSLGLSKEYEGSEWVGRSHESDEPGVTRHSLRWIAREAATLGLKAELAPYPIRNHQYWARITRAA